MDELKIIKIGGNVLDNEQLLKQFIQDFSALTGKKLLVHGGGKIATRMAQKLGLKTEMIDGKRITDAEMLRVITMVYGGLVNKELVARLQLSGCNAIGLTGADANIISSSKRPVTGGIDYGFVGDIEKVNDQALINLINAGYTAVLAPITHNLKGQLLNTNADNIASYVAVALSATFRVSLIYTFELHGVMADIHDHNSKFDRITEADFATLKEEKIIADGMVQKLESCFQAVDRGVSEVVICHASDVSELQKPNCGTRLLKG